MKWSIIIASRDGNLVRECQMTLQRRSLDNSHFRDCWLLLLSKLRTRFAHSER
ncbi:unnamed protein product [Linum tenue]|uniref:Uncharacterized protein n=1 Tax=Linum tenue TaxID=586396 RepID=A0AAV0PR04_9ROSI|nr:unnamed protein product [Linum tenue]